QTSSRVDDQYVTARIHRLPPRLFGEPLNGGRVRLRNLSLIDVGLNRLGNYLQLLSRRGVPGVPHRDAIGARRVGVLQPLALGRKRRLPVGLLLSAKLRPPSQGD